MTVIDLYDSFRGHTVDNQDAFAPTKVTSKPVRVSAELARFLEEKCEIEKIRQSEMLDRMFTTYLRDRPNISEDVSETTRSALDQHVPGILAALEVTNERLEALSQEQGRVLENQKQEAVFILLDRQLKGLSDATQKYSSLSNYISLSSRDIRDGLQHAESAIEKTLCRITEASNRMEELTGALENATRTNVEAAENFGRRLEHLKTAFNGYLEENIKEPTVRLIKTVEAEAYQDIKQAQRKANLALWTGIIAITSIAVIVSLSYLKNDNRAGPYSSFQSSLCTMKPTAGIRDLQSQFCKNKS